MASFNDLTKAGLIAAFSAFGFTGVEKMAAQNTVISTQSESVGEAVDKFFLAAKNTKDSKEFAAIEKTFSDKYPAAYASIRKHASLRQSAYGGYTQKLYTDIGEMSTTYWKGEYIAIQADVAVKLSNSKAASPTQGSNGSGGGQTISQEDQNELDFNKLITLEYRIKTYDIAQDGEFRSRLKAQYRKERFKDDLAGVWRDGLDLVKVGGTGILADIVGVVSQRTGDDIRRSGQNNQSTHQQKEIQRAYNETSSEYQEIMGSIGAGTYDARKWQDKKFILVEQRDALLDVLTDRGVSAVKIKELQKDGQKLAVKDSDKLVNKEKDRQKEAEQEKLATEKEKVTDAKKAQQEKQEITNEKRAVKNFFPEAFKTERDSLSDKQYKKSVKAFSGFLKDNQAVNNALIESYEKAHETDAVTPEKLMEHAREIYKDKAKYKEFINSVGKGSMGAVRDKAAPETGLAGIHGLGTDLGNGTLAFSSEDLSEFQKRQDFVAKFNAEQAADKVKADLAANGSWAKDMAHKAVNGDHSFKGKLTKKGGWEMGA